MTRDPMIDGEEIIPTPDSVPEPEVGRRSFVRRLSGDAAGMVGRLYGLSQVIAGSAAAAVQAVSEDLDSIRAREHAADAASTPTRSETADAEPVTHAESVAASPPEPVAAAAPVAEPAPVIEPVVRFEPAPEEAAILAGARDAAVAVNDGGNGPHVTFVRIHWDGETIRFGALGWARRSTLLRADGHVTLLVGGDNGRYLSVRGRASLLDGALARDAMRPLLDLDGRDWDELVADDPDRVVVIVQPHQILSVER